VKFAADAASEKPRIARVKFRAPRGVKYPASPDVKSDTKNILKQYKWRAEYNNYFVLRVI
jgi:hypothetical protein